MKAKTLAATLILGIGLAPGFLPCQEAQGLTVNEYKIGPKDLLEISIYELPELNGTFRVAEDGSITMSFLGNVEVAGYTTQGLERRLAALLNEKYTPAGAHVTVFIREFQKISVIGAVGKPGMYELVGPMTLLEAVAQAGGLTGQAMSELFVYRTGADGVQERIAVRVEDLTSGGRQDLNIPLQPKDVVMVPIDQTLNVFVYGEVRSPGAIAYQRSKKITLLQAIAQAGGPTEWAKKSKVVIKRMDRETGKELKIRVNLKNMIDSKVADIVLEEGDVVIVP